MDEELFFVIVILLISLRGQDIKRGFILTVIIYNLTGEKSS